MRVHRSIRTFVLMCCCSLLTLGGVQATSAERSPHTLFPITNDLHAVWGTAPDNVWAAGLGIILHYDGTTWSQVYDGPELFEGLWGSAANDVFAVGWIQVDLFTRGSVIFHFDGTSWTPMPIGFPHRLGALNNLFLLTDSSRDQIRPQPLRCGFASPRSASSPRT